jgi:NTE family protein
MLTLPTWDLTDPSKRDTTLGFGYDAKVDPTLDQQTQEVTRAFFQSVLGQLEDPKASGSNIPKSIEKDFTFSIPVSLKEGDCVANYAGGDSVSFTRPDGSTFSKKLGRDQIEAIYADQLAFGGLASQLAFEVDGSVIAKAGNGLPF